MRWGRRMPEEAKARGHALARLTSGRCRERYSGESEAMRQHTGFVPDGGLARHPLEARPPACLPSPKADVPSHATWTGQNSAPTPEVLDQVVVGPAPGGASGHPSQPRQPHRGPRWRDGVDPAATAAPGHGAPSRRHGPPAATHVDPQTREPRTASLGHSHPGRSGTANARPPSLGAGMGSPVGAAYLRLSPRSLLLGGDRSPRSP
jgi:hypothetical protein